MKKKRPWHHRESGAMKAGLQTRFQMQSWQPVSDEGEVRAEHGSRGCQQSRGCVASAHGQVEPRSLTPTRAGCKQMPEPAEAYGGETGDNHTDEDVEDRSAREMQEFYDLLKKTALVDVRCIDAQLHDQISGRVAPSEGWESKTMEKVWEMASRLKSVGEVVVRVGKKLQNLGASQSPWGWCLVVTEIAGKLLRKAMEKAAVSSS